MEIGTIKMENGKDWDWKVHGKHVENSANSTIYVLPKVLDVYYSLAVSLAMIKYCFHYTSHTCSHWLKSHGLTKLAYSFMVCFLTVLDFSVLTTWLFSHCGLSHDFSVIVMICHMTFQSLWWFATWLFSHCGIFIHDFAFIVWFSIQSQQFIGFPYNCFHSECSQ